MSIESAISQIEQLVALKTASLSTFSATVTSLSGGKVGLRRLGSASPDGQLYPRLTGFALTVGDEVICINLLGTAFVLGKTQRAPAGVLKLDATGFVGEVITNRAFLTDGSTATTTNNATYAGAILKNWTLPTGTWTVEIDASANFKRGVAGLVDFQVYVAGSAVTASYLAVDAQVTYYTTARVGVAVTSLSGSVDFESRYKNNAGGNTVTCKNPFIRMIATRTA